MMKIATMYKKGTTYVIPLSHSFIGVKVNGKVEDDIKCACNSQDELVFKSTYACMGPVLSNDCYVIKNSSPKLQLAGSWVEVKPEDEPVKLRNFASITCCCF